MRRKHSKRSHKGKKYSRQEPESDDEYIDVENDVENDVAEISGYQQMQMSVAACELPVASDGANKAGAAHKLVEIDLFCYENLAGPSGITKVKDAADCKSESKEAHIVDPSASQQMYTLDMLATYASQLPKLPVPPITEHTDNLFAELYEKENQKNADNVPQPVDDNVPQPVDDNVPKPVDDNVPQPVAVNPLTPSKPTQVSITRIKQLLYMTWKKPPGMIDEYVVCMRSREEFPNDNPRYIRVYCGRNNHCYITQSIIDKAFIDILPKPNILFHLSAKNVHGYGAAIQVRWIIRRLN